MKHEYTPQQALELLMRKLTARDEALAAEVQAVVNAGKDVREIEYSSGHKKLRSYRRTIPYSPEEALEVALDALNAHFVQQPLFANALLHNMANSAMAVIETRQARSPASNVKVEAVGDQKAVEIELQTETQLLRGTVLTRREPETLAVRRLSDDAIKGQQTNIGNLKSLFDFTED